MKTRTRRPAVIVLTLIVFLLVLLNTGSAFAGSSGSFYLMAATESKMIISPVKVNYEEGMTIREALMASGYEFEGIDSNGFISAVEGYTASFSLFYDGGGFTLEENASSITAIVFMDNSAAYSEDFLSMVRLMGEYAESKNNVQNYPKAKEIYEDALDDMRSPETENVKKLYDGLLAAMKEYEDIISSEKFTVTVNASKGDVAVTELHMTFTDEYGNVTKSENNVIKLVKGKYSFVISDKGLNRVEGSITISGERQLDVKLADKDWFGDIKILDNNKLPFEYTVDSETKTNTYLIPDSVGRTGMFLNAQQGDVIDKSKTKLYTVYIGTDGDDKSDSSRSWDSKTTALAALLENGLKSKEFTLEAKYPYETDDGVFTMVQAYNMILDRKPTLSSLSIKASVTELLEGFESITNEYSITTVSDRLDVNYETFGDDYSVTIDGEDISVIDLTGKDSHKAVITVKSGEVSNSYVVNITKVAPVNVTIKSDSGVSVEVFNETGSPVKDDGGTYKLIGGKEYTYIATREEFFHTTASFTAKDGLTVSAVTPDVTDALTDFVLYNTSTVSTRYEYSLDSKFAADDHGYVVTYTDMNSAPYAQATPISGYTVNAVFVQQSLNINVNGVVEEPIKIDKTVNREGSARYLKNLVAKSGYSQILTVRLEKTTDGVKYYQDYEFRIGRSLHMNDIATTGEILLAEEDGKNVSFDNARSEYHIFVPKGTESLTLNMAFPNELDDTDCCGGYYAMIQGNKYEDVSEVTLALNTAMETEDINIEVFHKDEYSVSGTYTLHIVQQEPVYVTFNTVPEDAIVYVKNDITGKRVNETDGKFALNPNGPYTYTVTRNGYAGKKAEFRAPEADATMEVSLNKAPEGDNITIYDSWWSSFRADKNNNGIISAKTPVKSEDTVLYWATKIGDGFDKNACGCPIIVDGYLYTYAGTTLYKVDTVNGEIVATGEMDHSSSFAVNPPTYADGMIFVGLAEGCVQAFSAETLESLWIYRDELGGQPNCTIYYHDGYIYTGFWLGEVVDANYVCLSVTDEDPTKDKEEKIPTWTYTSKGGFYWAGAFVNDDFVIIGTDDGAAGYTTGRGRVVTFSTKTGEVIDEITMPNAGDIRSGIVYDENADEYYFSSKGGYFYGLKVEKDGKIMDSSLRYIRLDNGQNIATAPPMSTSTPCVYNQRAYVGVSGISQFGPYSGHNICVLDLKNWEVAYTVPTQGYPQTSGILTTAYEEESGCVYVYFIDNYTPGKLRVISDKPNQTRPSEMTTESFTSGGKTTSYDTAYVIFTPDGDQAQYAICSPIVDEYGTIYFKNDSAYLMAIGSTIDKITIENLPDKLSYDEGEAFEAAGMKVVATYSNGLTRDVTKYVSYSKQPLTVDDTSLEIRYECVKYQDKDGQAGSLYTPPIAFVELEVKGKAPEISAEECDLNDDGKINSDDFSMVLMNYGMKQT